MVIILASFHTKYDSFKRREVLIEMAVYNISKPRVYTSVF